MEKLDKSLPISIFLERHSRLGRPMEVSPLCNDSFPGMFNASGFHQEILELKPGEKGYGIDGCIRHLDFEGPDPHHKASFLMGIFASSINREMDGRGDFTNPATHTQLFDFQSRIIDQFFGFIGQAGVNLEEVSATVFDGAIIGSQHGANKGRDGYLKRSYELAPDEGGLLALSDHIGKDRIFPVRSIANLDINPAEGALVGPRIEIAVRDFEIATVVFDYYKIRDRKLFPVDYIGGYAIGMERLRAAQTPGGNLYNTGILAEAKVLLDSSIRAKEGFGSPVFSPLMQPSVRQMLSSVEALIHVSRADEQNIAGNRHRRAFVNTLRDTVLSSAKEMGMKNGALKGFVEGFAGLLRGSLPPKLSEVGPKTALKVLGLG